MDELFHFQDDCSNIDDSDFGIFESEIESTLVLSSVYSSGFDENHPMPSYDGLRNAGFSDFLANQILFGDGHCYSQKELFNALYSDDPLSAYNEMIDSKVNNVLNRSDKLIEDIQNELGIY